MEDKKEKLVAYLTKNLRLAEEVVDDFDRIGKDIKELEEALEQKKLELEALGDFETAKANVDEIRGFIEDLTKPEDVPEEVCDEEICESCIIETGEEEEVKDNNQNRPTFF